MPRCRKALPFGQAGAIRHPGIQSRQQAFIERRFTLTACPAGGQVLAEARALFSGVRQLMKAVRQLDAVDVELEPCGHSRDPGLQPRK